MACAFSANGQYGSIVKNHLTGTSSPYLLRNSSSPVDWYPWGGEALEKARRENKLLIISIGFYSCHWCHVMEKECFSEPGVAEYMNKNFVCIKVDREEKPDVDQLYLDAIQMLTGNSGWPLNAIAVPGGAPLSGGHFFSADEWMQLLTSVQSNWTESPSAMKQISSQILSQSGELPLSDSKSISSEADFQRAIENLKSNIDTIYWGFGSAPKFPYPEAINLLLDAFAITEDTEPMNLAVSTLGAISGSALKDQLGIGFARYTSDSAWTKPHFEKMLSTNAELALTYIHAYQVTGIDLFREEAYSALEFISEELISKSGGFCSSVDSDSEGEEGRYYTWNKSEFIRLLGDDASLMISFFNLNDMNEERTALYPCSDPEKLRTEQKLSREDFDQRIARSIEVLKNERNNRTKPHKDEKAIVAWNALTIKAFSEAYHVFREKKFLSEATRAAKFIEKKMMKADSSLSRLYFLGKASGNGYLDDYAYLADAFISLYQSTFNEHWLVLSRQCTDFALQHFSDKKSGLFFYSPDTETELPYRKIEIADGETPSANAVMMRNLFVLGIYFENDEYIARCKDMWPRISERAIGGGQYFASWNRVLPWLASEPFLVVIGGKKPVKATSNLGMVYTPGALFCGASRHSILPVTANKPVTGNPVYFLCRRRICQQPISDLEEMLIQILH